MSPPRMESSPRATRAIFLHGFGQNGRCLGPLGDALGRSWRIDAPDLPGHGTNLPGLTMWDTAAQLNASILPQPSVEAGDDGQRTDGSGPPALIGYSMGGRAALHMALTSPPSALLLISASPGLRHADERAQRRASDERLAERVLQIGAALFAEEWMRLPMFAGIPPDLRFLEERAANSPIGLAQSLRRSGTGAQDSLWERLGEIAAPTLILSGSKDQKFTDIAGEMAALIPSAQHVIIDGAGHSPHLERPRHTAAAIASFAERLTPT